MCFSYNFLCFCNGLAFGGREPLSPLSLFTPDKNLLKSFHESKGNYSSYERNCKRDRARAN